MCDDKRNKTGVMAVGEAATGAISASEYIKSGLLSRECLPTPNSMVHWPQWINHNGGCNVNYMTPGAGSHRSGSGWFNGGDTLILIGKLI